MNRRTLALSAALWFLGSSISMAASYTIARQDGGINTLVQGKEYGYEITSSPAMFENILLENDGSPLADYSIRVGVGVQKGPNAYKPDGTGKLVFFIRFNKAPGNVLLTARNSADSNINTTISIALQRYPVTFQMTPPSPTVDADVPFNIDVIAVDGLGNWVSAFDDQIQISQLFPVTSTVTVPVAGSDFVSGGGKATVSINLQAGDMNNQNKLRILFSGTNYTDPSLPGGENNVSPATYTSNFINVRPGAFSKLVMLFPGEVLVPGVGKDSANISTQTAGANVSAVTIWRVDQFFNPLRDTVATIVSFTSSNPSDIILPYKMPDDRTMNVPPLQILGVAADPFKFPSNGVRTIKATPDGDDSKADTSNVPVNPGSVFSYEFTQQPPSGPITTEDVITVRITAYDGTHTILTTLNGQLAGAKLSAKTTAEDRVEWVDTNNTTDIPDNRINFSAGVAIVNLVVTKRATGVQLHFQDQFGVGVLSNSFDVNRGAANRILFTVVGKLGATPLIGEIYDAGTYPGNKGTPPTVKAGDQLIVEARVTDRRFNLFSDISINTLPITVTGENSTNFLNATHPLDPQVKFDSTGQLIYDSNPSFDNSFRVTFRTAGPQQKIRGNTSLGAGSFFSSTIPVAPDVYSKLVLQTPGETLRPGTTSFANGKEAVVPMPIQAAGVSFNGTVFATDQFFNPVAAGPYPQVNFAITPDLPSSFISGTLPAQMFSSSKVFSITLSSGSNVKVSDVATPSINQTVPVAVGAGVLDHFAFIMTDTITPKKAGVAFNVTIQARDIYDNVVTNFTNTLINLSADTGANTMSPTTVTLVSGEINTNLTLYTATFTSKVNMTYTTVTSKSAGFNVGLSPAGYSKLLLLMNGETSAPGVITLPGKFGTPTPVTVGAISNIRAIACDPYYNPINVAADVKFVDDQYSQLGADQGSLVNVDGHGEYSTTFLMRAAAIHNVIVRDLNNDAIIARSTSSIQGLVGTYKKLQLIAPGEVADPGTLNANGKTGAPATTQKVGVPFTVSIRAVDDFWNVVTSFNGGDIRLGADTTAILFDPLNNVDTPTTTPRPFVNGVATRDVFFGTSTVIQVTATDDANLTKPGQTVSINSNPGPLYNLNITSLGNVVAGRPFGFTITLEESGTPVAGYNQSIFLEPVLAAGGAASGGFTPDRSPKQYVMTNGSVTISDLSYDYVESIRIRLTDGFNRVSFSNAIDVKPSGLKYKVIVPPTAVAGPPTSFDVTVQLLDENTNTLIKNHDHEVKIEVISAISATTDGQYSVNSVNLAQGVVNFQESYTKAESIIIRASESLTNGDPGFVIPAKTSSNILVKADGYKKLLLLAPGEVHMPGVPSAEGKDSSGKTTRQLGVAFLLQVRAVDQYWNLSDTTNGGRIELASSDSPASLNTTNPINQDAPLINGESASSIVIYTANDVDITVRDLNNPGIAVQTTKVKVGGNFYEITTPSQEFAGPPTQFTMGIVLKDSLTGSVVTSANQTVQLFAYHTDGTSASGSLGVSEAQVSNGILNIPNQSYSIAEDLVIRVFEKTTNSVKNSGQSGVIHMVARQVSYTFEMPTEAEVNKPFSVVIRVIDQDTGTPVKNFSRSNDLQAYSAITGGVVSGIFTPSGAGVVNISSGVGIINAQYDKAESIFLIMRDNTASTQESAPTQSTFTSQGAINVKPGAFDNLNIPATITLQSNDTKVFNLVARDSNGIGNPIPNQTLIFAVSGVNQSGDLIFNGKHNTLTQKTNAQGEITLTLTPDLTANGDYAVTITDGDRTNGKSIPVKVTVLGFPSVPARAPVLGGNRIQVGTPLFLNLGEINTNGGTLRTFYRVDGNAYAAYNPSVGISGLTETRAYKIDWYSEICYDVTCSNPVSQLAINGGPQSDVFRTVEVAGKLAGYPNPFSPKSGDGLLKIQYSLDAISSVDFDIYDLFGQKVRHWSVDAGQNGGKAGLNDLVTWNGVNDDGIVVANGGYILVVKAGATGQEMKTKILVVK